MNEKGSGKKKDRTHERVERGKRAAELLRSISLLELTTTVLISNLTGVSAVLYMAELVLRIKLVI